MKKIIFTFAVVLCAFQLSIAQKIGYVNTKDIMSKMDEYNSAQSEINSVSQKWQGELEKMYQVIEEKYRDYQANEVIMPEDIRKEKQEEIFKLERDAKEYREKKFGYNGELFTLQDSKIKPIQERVAKSVETVAKLKRVDFVFDKAGSEATWIYTNAIFDLTNDVLKDLGLEAAPAGGASGGAPAGGSKPAGR